MTATTTITAEELLEKLLERLSTPVIPISIDLWDMAMIAAFLKRDTQNVRERMACLPSFPKAIRLPTIRGKSNPLYNAKEVIAWAQSYRDKN